ncbi:hypothetical protein GLOIN_2v1693544 [Rhizophagus irregularis DAOM 181602=DAOM 197198]|uniref:Uncharacterized protein n=1 Tax=Rhizophagus irregularis (strain DAOM 181602 / DAOM 197198 / MUCL 43194) TaxID=747089 RepID=A0A2P4PBJ2_RHIID|nr:hypothetical protein GLOIN_2v1693544 [Rhizophagus irregularis DAOM 181602=DAOM 197198]POG62740.1 hypothetical protein GLOIN_2v1693544 [Rhizophagus irregularis DAOM 181602=DAOM 197198]GET49740.1 hypothetical protein GLOIN_2v1693544 [Rhizophagus irregularis DAOM 181602=DAOM 197198]|eukprot:XP_025169606.1 hypothetical protein GLOIN_2v1693544 [Rhizophagus irregularis DAOM 181602=DAOM 197198]
MIKTIRFNIFQIRTDFSEFCNLFELHHFFPPSTHGTWVHKKLSFILTIFLRHHSNIGIFAALDFAINWLFLYTIPFVIVLVAIPQRTDVPNINFTIFPSFIDAITFTVVGRPNAFGSISVILSAKSRATTSHIVIIGIGRQWGGSTNFPWTPYGR